MIVKLYIGNDDPTPWLIDGTPPNVGETVWLRDMNKPFSSFQKYVVVRRDLSVMRIKDKDVGSYEIILELTP